MCRVACAGALALLAACGSGAGGSDDAENQLLPAESTLCKLVIGYGPDDVPGAFEVPGTNADDVRAVLGEPAKHTDTEYDYEWCVGDSCAKRVSATLKLERKERCYRDTGKPITPPYWLASIDVEGFARPKCWTIGSEMPKLCTECTPDGQVVECE